jgi:hypothetical protein
MQGRISAKICLACLVSAAVCFPLPPTIGIASAVGSFVVNSNAVAGNANLFDGSEIKTTKASSQVFLQSGASLILGIDSAGTVYRNHLLLQRGATKVDNMDGFSVHAGDYRIEQSQPASQAVVRLNADTVEIAALSGGLSVFDKKGAMLTRIGAGTASAFQNGNPYPDSGNGSASPNSNNRLKVRTAEYLLLAGTLAGLGLAVAAIMQPEPTSH